MGPMNRICLCLNSGLIILDKGHRKEVHQCPICRGNSRFDLTLSEQPTQINIPEVSAWEILQAQKAPEEKPS